MQTHNLGYPRIGSNRELKKACEQYWSGKSSFKNLLRVGKISGFKTGNYKRMQVLTLFHPMIFHFMIRYWT